MVVPAPVMPNKGLHAHGETNELAFLKKSLVVCVCVCVCVCVRFAFSSHRKYGLKKLLIRRWRFKDVFNLIFC